MGNDQIGEPVSGRAGIKTFLIADVRGYTLFTQERGDEAAAKLATRFAGIAREAVDDHGGSVIELRGDEALAVFDSARQAIRAAVWLQQRFLEETESDPSLPLPVGIGVDAGEAVPVEGGYRGGALNLAARLCGQAGPGEILASEGVLHLARKVDGVRTVDRGRLHLKGLEEPVRVFRVISEEADPAERMRSLAPAPPSRRPAPLRLARRHPAVAVAVAGLAVLVVAAAIGIPLAVHRLRAGLPAIDANAAGTIDPASGHITRQVPLGDIPRGIASGAGSVWVALAASGSVARVDPSSQAVRPIPVGSGPTGMAFGDGFVWVSNTDARSVSRINPASNTVVQTIPVGNAPSAITFGAGFVWVTNTLDGTVSKIDPRTGDVKATIPVGANPAGITVGAGSVWVSNEASGTVDRINLTSNTVVQPITVGDGPTGMTFDRNTHTVWVANTQDGTLSRIDTNSGVVTATKVGTFPGALATGGGSVWAADEGQNTVSRIDPASGDLQKTINVSNAPQGLGFVGGSLWVTVRGSAASHRGGTLSVVASQGPASIDPNASYDSSAYAVLTNTNDGLLSYARVGGAAGSSLVPDLATTIPASTNEGRTYTFRLRRDVHYSDGTIVRPTDVLHSFERAFTIGAGPAYYLDSLVGSKRCSTKGCHLSNAIVPDDAASTVTFYLRAADPEFLDVLGMPFLAIVPSSAPSHDIGTHPLPATGPYMIASYAQGKKVQLVRNPYFREWSPAAQPAGYPDRIVFRFGVKGEQATIQVEQRRADVLLDDPPADRVKEIQTQFAAQSHPYVGLGVLFMFLNTRVPPFDNLQVRQALNYAVDRATMAALPTGGPFGVGPVTCQALPPNFPGYAPYCPYTQGPTSTGTWKAPDLAKAHELVDGSGTKHMKVVVWTFPALEALAVYIVSVLKELGYHASIKSISSSKKSMTDEDAYFYAISDSSNRAQIGPAGWAIDFPAPANMIEPTLRCDAFVPNDPNNNNVNVAEFCDHKLDKRIRAALRLQTTDPPRANTIWAQIDKMVVNEAPWVPFDTLGGIHVVSARVGNYQYNPVLGVLVGQLWVQN